MKTNEAVTRSRESRPHAPVAQRTVSPRKGLQSAGLLSWRTPVQIGPGAPISNGVSGAGNTGHPQPRHHQEQVGIEAGRPDLSISLSCGLGKQKKGAHVEYPQTREEAGGPVRAGRR